MDRDLRYTFEDPSYPIARTQDFRCHKPGNLYCLLRASKIADLARPPTDRDRRTACFESSTKLRQAARTVNHTASKSHRAAPALSILGNVRRRFYALDLHVDNGSTLTMHQQHHAPYIHHAPYVSSSYIIPQSPITVKLPKQLVAKAGCHSCILNQHDRPSLWKYSHHFPSFLPNTYQRHTTIMRSSLIFALLGAMLSMTTASILPDSCGLSDLTEPLVCVDDLPVGLNPDITDLKCSFKLYVELNGQRNYFGIGYFKKTNDPRDLQDPFTGLLTAQSNRKPSVLTLHSGRSSSSSRFIRHNKTGTEYGDEQTLYLARYGGFLRLARLEDDATEAKMNFKCINGEPRLVLLPPGGTSSLQWHPSSQSPRAVTNCFPQSPTTPIPG
jgi:hypothetical protein